MLPRKWFLLAAFVLLIVPFASLSAQDQPTISIALPSIMRNLIDESIFDDFESANGVQVYVNYVDAFIPPPADDMSAFLDAIADYVASADVLFFQNVQYNPYLTRAGYLLDLSPLTSTDSSLNPDDFFPVAWESLQWDGGVWALPVSLDADMLIYDPAAFDQAGLPYPNDRWTMDDLSNAAKALTQYNADGSIRVPGLSAFGDTANLIRSLYGQNFADASGSPRFTDPALETIMTQWQDLVDGSYVGSTFTSGSSDQVPMRIMSSVGLSFSDPNNPSTAVALPGGGVGLTLSALAVSSGTQQPELAYALAKYLTSNPALVNSPFGGFPARQSLAGALAAQQPTNQTSSVGGSTGGIHFTSAGSSPQAQAALSQLLPQALTLIDQGYGDYVNRALSAMSNDGIDAHTALQDAEAQAASDLQAASDQRALVSVVVATPPPPVVLQLGEIALNFGVQSNIQPIPNLDQWQRLATDFAAADPDVGVVNLDVDFGGALDYAQRDDCFVLTSNAVPNLDSSTILNLDPYLDTDPNFDPNDLVGGLLAQLQKDNHTWAYPLSLQPQTLSYSVSIFEQAGVPLPDGTWTLDQFNDALRTLKDYLDKTPFVSHDLNGESLLMLIAAYGGLPIDNRTSPPTFNFTDPATVDAIRQVLDLSKNGYIDYRQLANIGGVFSIAISSGDEQPDAITSDFVGVFLQIVGGPKAGSDQRQMVSYPSGTYTGAGYGIGTGYISATAPNPDACYRWLSYLAQHVDVFSAMPARISQINDPTFQASAGANAAFYASYAQLLQSPTTLVFPSAGGNSKVSDFIPQYWLFRAFDDYVLHDADLSAELADAQTYVTAFQQCVAGLPPEATTGGIGQQGVNTGVQDCATTIDASLASLFPGG